MENFSYVNACYLHANKNLFRCGLQLNLFIAFWRGPRLPYKSVRENIFCMFS